MRPLSIRSFGLGIAALFLIAGASSLLYAGSSEDDSVAISDNVSKPQSKLQVLSNRRCPVYVRFEINNVQYEVDANYHTSFEWGDIEGNKHRLKEFRDELSKCQSIDIGEIKSIAMAGDKGVIIQSGQGDATTTYKRHIKAISDARDNNQVIEIGDDIEKIVINGRDLYILPQSVAKTANNEPILMDCAGGNSPRTTEFDRCGLRFMHTDGNYIGDGFWSENFPEDKLLAAYQRTLDHYNRFKIEKED